MQMEKQIAFLEEQIALLKGEGLGTKGLGTKGLGARGIRNREDVKNETLSPNPYSLSPREALPAPVLAVLTSAGDSVFVRWSEVAGASSYEISLAYDADFTKPAGMMGVDGSRTWATLPEMYPDTTWFIHVRALGSDASMSSAWSNARSIRTLPEGMAGTNDEIATHLQTWLNDLQTGLQNTASLVPQLDNTELNTNDRRRLLGSGVRRYGFIEKVFEVSAEYSQFWPPFGTDREALNESVKEIDVLRNLVIWFRHAGRLAQDLLLIASDDAFRAACAYYALARDGARRKNSEAVQVYQMLKLFWHKRRRTPKEPTLPEIERDFHRVLYGLKDGTVSAQHESPTLAGGSHEVIDNVHSARCRGQGNRG